MASQSSEKKYIYILKLRQGKWYIGSTTNLTQRLARHFEGTGSAWTSLFPPEELFDCQTQRDGWHEENLTKEYMCLFGIENVRGGPYTNVDFTEDEEEMIRRALDSFIGACYSCGSTSHIASRCPNGNRIDSPPRRNRTSQNLNENSDACFRCGRPGHFASECYATIDSTGNRIDSPPRRNRTSQNLNENSDACFRCGRPGHYASECYATVDSNGNRLDWPYTNK